MTQTQWLQLIAGIAVLILIFPMAIHVFRQQHALRNAVIILALLTALVFGFLNFGHLLPDNVKQNFGITGREPIMMDTAPGEEAPAQSDGPVRNL